MASFEPDEIDFDNQYDKVDLGPIMARYNFLNGHL